MQKLESALKENYTYICIYISLKYSFIAILQDILEFRAIDLKDHVDVEIIDAAHSMATTY